jgi:DNA-directed RNA polymerase specialized sigma24 family protein
MAEQTYHQHLDKNALVEIYEQYNPKIYRYAFRLLGDAELAEECVSETFSRLLQIVKKGGGPGEYIQAYLYRCALCTGAHRNEG